MMNGAGSLPVSIPEVESYCKYRANGCSQFDAYRLVFIPKNEGDKLLTSLLADMYEQFNIVQDRIAYLQADGVQDAKAA